MTETPYPLRPLQLQPVPPTQYDRSSPLPSPLLASGSRLGQWVGADVSSLLAFIDEDDGPSNFSFFNDSDVAAAGACFVTNMAAVITGCLSIVGMQELP